MSRDTLRTLLGPFTVIPIWVLGRCHDSNAIHLYAYLAKHANRARVAWPGQDKLSASMKVSVSTVQRALAELVKCGIIETRRHRTETGQLSGTEYVLLAKPIGKPHTSRVKSGPHVTGEADRTSPVTPLSISELDPIELDPKVTIYPSKPQNGTVYAGGHVPKPKKPIKSKHTDHVFCGAFVCLDLEKLKDFEKRIVLAGGSLEDFDVLAWVQERDAELDAGSVTTTEHPAFWLAKQFGEALKAEFGAAS